MCMANFLDPLRLQVVDRIKLACQNMWNWATCCDLGIAWYDMWCIILLNFIRSLYATHSDTGYFDVHHNYRPHGITLHGITQYCMASRHHIAWHHTPSHGITRHHTTSHHITSYEMIRHGMASHGMISYGMVPHGMLCHHMA